MKKTLVLINLLAIAMLFSCSKVEDKCIIKGQFSGGDGELTVLAYQEVKSQKEADSLSYKAKIVDGKFSLEIDKVLASRNIYLTVDKKRKSYTLFSEPGEITIKEVNGELVANGSVVNDEFHQLREKLNYKSYEKLKYKRGLTEAEKQLKEPYVTILWDLLEQYSTSIPLSQLFYEKYWNADVETFNKIINSFSKDIHNSYYISKMISRRDNQQRVAVGKQAPAFTLKTEMGKDVSLETYKGKYLLVDFWASWCGPCRAGIPNLKEIYKDYQSKGLEILSVSTDAEEKAWLKAVEKEQMPWAQLRDTKKVSTAYNITAIPAIFLIDPNGKIIDKGLHGEAIRKRVEEVLK